MKAEEVFQDVSDHAAWYAAHGMPGSADVLRLLALAKYYRAEAKRLKAVCNQRGVPPALNKESEDLEKALHALNVEHGL